MQRGILQDGESESMTNELASHLLKGNGQDYTQTDHLVKLMKKQPHFLLFLDGIKRSFSSAMQIHLGNFTQISSLPDVKTPRFSWWDNSSLAILVGGTQE